MTALHFTAVRLRLAPNAIEVTESSLPRDQAEERPSQGCGATPALTSYDIADTRSGRISPRALAERLVTKGAFGPMAELLVEDGAPLDAKAKERSGLTPLQLAVTMGHMDVAQVLLAQAPPSARRTTSA